MRKLKLTTLFAICALALAASARADVSVAWTAPADGSAYPVGTLVNPVGQASATGITGSGLDLALVLDSSGSMTTTVGGKSLQNWQKEAAIALVNALPQGSTAVAVIEFDSDANTIRQLTQLTTDKAAVIAAINSVDASGGTNIGTGITAATTALTGALHTAGRSQQMVVMSDGYTLGDPEVNAVAAIAAGVDSIHTVGLPGHNPATMKDIVNGPDNIIGNSDDYGTYTDGTDVTALSGIFDGTGGNLVGIDHVDITEPDGTFLGSVAVDGLGNFAAPTWAIQSGAQTWIATAYDTSGNSASASLTLYGQSVPNGVPDGGSTLALLGLGLLGMASLRRRMGR
jgi:hypothetical protein